MENREPEIEIKQGNGDRSMIEIKKRSLIAIIVVSLLVGCLGAGGAMYAISAVGVGEDGRRISKEDYDEYQHYKETYGKLDELKEFVSENYYTEISDEDLMNGIYKGLFAGTGDIYSEYMTKLEYEQMMASTMGEYTGVGITMEADSSGYIVVVAPTDGTPADRAGIKTGDRILAVDGKEYSAKSVDLAASAIRGKAGTKVSITIQRASDGKEVTLELRREKIVSKTVTSKMLDDNIGYIRISGFEQNTAKDFEKELHSMEVNGAGGVVIDLRGNGGGLVDASVEIADRLLPEGTISYTETQKGEREYYKSKAGATELPYVLLVNGGSASASEILAGAVKDNGGGALVGTKTFGKGIIQMLQELPDGDGFKLTVMQYFSPNGNAIQKIGIEPDVKVELTDEDYDEEGNLVNDRQLNRAVELLQKAK